MGLKECNGPINESPKAGECSAGEVVIQSVFSTTVEEASGFTTESARARDTSKEGHDERGVNTF
eukprot:5260364-Prorocentrum_lima.AAC.1